jgi:predicted ATPase
MSPAVQLLVERMRDAGRTVLVDGTTGPLIAEMCRKLDGLPLAIELAAARIRDVDLATIARDLDRRLDTLDAGPRDAVRRQQTMRGAIAWSFELLEADEAALFRRMSVFAGGATRDGIEAVCGEGLEGSLDAHLSALVRQSLVVRREAGETEARYAMLATIREFAAEQLASSAEEPRLGRLHADWFLAFAETAENELHGPSSAAWARRVRAELDNIRSVVAWAVAENEPEIGLRLVASLRFFLPETGHLTEGRLWLKQLLDLSNPVSDRVRGDALNAAGNLALLQGDLLGAGSRYEASLALRRSVGDLASIAASLSNLSQVASGRGDYLRAQELLEESLRASREAADVWGVAATLGNLADVALFVRDFARADDLFREGLTAFRALGDVASVATVLSNLGQLAIYRGEHDVAFALLQEAERLVDQLEIPSQANTIRLNFGHLASRRGEFNRARELLAASYRFSRSSGNQVGIAECLERLGELLWREADTRTAARVWGGAATIRDDGGAEMYPVDRAWFDEAVKDARSRLGNPVFESEWRVGGLIGHESLAIAHLGIPNGLATPAID